MQMIAYPSLDACMRQHAPSKGLASHCITLVILHTTSHCSQLASALRPAAILHKCANLRPKKMSLMLLLLLLFLTAAAILLLCEQSYARTNTRHVRLHNATPTYTYLPINFWKTPRTQPHTDTYLHARTPYVHILPAATTTNHTPQ